jgi:hypothetical protein
VAEETAATSKKERHDGSGPDKSPRATEEAQKPQRAELSNYEVVSH